jgi:NADPH:quinone reductase-like Zn-dependent oxidoreductase
VIERKIRPVVGGMFPFEQGAEAHQLMHENRHQGKLVLQVQAPR